MDLGIVSLLLLAVSIAIGFFRKTNVGLVCLFFAFVLGKAAGVPTAEILKGFKPNLFINLMGVTLLFSILNKNGTIELLARKIVNLAGSNKYLIPIAVFIMGALLTGIGPGSIPLLAIMPAVAIPLAKARGYNPLMLAIIGCSGCFGGRMSPITPEGLLSYDLLQQSGLDAAAAVQPIYTAQLVSGILIALVAFVYYRGYRIQMPEKDTKEKLDGFTGRQLLSLLGLMVMAVLVIVFKQNVGLTSFSVSAVLLMCHAAPERDSLKAIPWGVLLVVSGVSTLMNLAIKTGGIKLLTAALATFMNSYTAPAVMACTAGVMSLFSSGLGVVFPTLLPTVASLGQSVGVSPVELASMVVIGGTITGISPISTTGGLIMATLMADENGTAKKDEEMKLFMELTVWALGILVVLTLLAGVGFYHLIF